MARTQSSYDLFQEAFRDARCLEQYVGEFFENVRENHFTTEGTESTELEREEFPETLLSDLCVLSGESVLLLHGFEPVKRVLAATKRPFELPNRAKVCQAQTEARNCISSLALQQQPAPRATLCI